MLISLQILRQIPTGPRSALDLAVAQKGRSSKAQLHNLTSTTGCIIACAYVIVSICRAFNHCQQYFWLYLDTGAHHFKRLSLDDDAFEYSVFSQNIVTIFEETPGPEDPWVNPDSSTRLLEVPRRKRAGLMDPIARLAAQRAAKEAASKPGDQLLPLLTPK